MLSKKIIYVRTIEKKKDLRVQNKMIIRNTNTSL